MDNGLLDWLLEGEPWVEYRTRLDLLGQSEEDTKVVKARLAALEDARIQVLIGELAGWPGPVLKSHKKAGHFLHKLGFLAEIGFKADDPGMEAVVQQVLKHQAAEGPFQVLVNVHPRYGGTGEDELAWMLCDAPLVTYALVRFGLGQAPEIQESVTHLTNLARENGWPCAVSGNMGKFRGPGRASDPCPYANLLMVKLLAQFPERHHDPALKTGVEILLALWDQRKERRPYLFAMGTDFAKLKAPLIWYDILHVCDVLTAIPWTLEDQRLHEMVDMVRSKGDEGGRFTPESIWMDWKGWEFGQKKVASRWVTLVAQRVLKRAGKSSWTNQRGVNDRSLRTDYEM